MYTQNTAVNVELWHRPFWLMATANLLLTMSVYALLPVLPFWMGGVGEWSSPLHVALAMGLFAVGVWLPGPFCSYLVQRFRRNHVCMLATALLAASFLLFPAMEGEGKPCPVACVLALRLVQGVLFGLAKSVLMSTLVVDVCASRKRTEANHSSAWFGRFALSLGPVAGFVSCMLCGAEGAFVLCAALASLALALVASVKFPFRTPGDNVRLVSLDRFYLAEGTVLFVNLVLISASVGLVFSLRLPALFYGWMMAGFLLALLAQRFVFRNAELKSEVVSGLLLMMAGLAVLLLHVRAADMYLAPVLFATGYAVCSARFVLFYIKLCRHCQRGTSQSTNLLGWETGLGLGLFIGLTLTPQRHVDVLQAAIAFSAVALLMYVAYTHAWFLRHKNR